LNVVYLVVCGAGPATRAHRFVEAARATGWDCHVIVTDMGAKFIDERQLEQASGHPVTLSHRQPYAQARPACR
jgi:hypothetical protein